MKYRPLFIGFISLLLFSGCPKSEHYSSSSISSPNLYNSDIVACSDLNYYFSYKHDAYSNTKNNTSVYQFNKNEKKLIKIIDFDSYSISDIYCDDHNLYFIDNKNNRYNIDTFNLKFKQMPSDGNYFINNKESLQLLTSCKSDYVNGDCIYKEMPIVFFDKNGQKRYNPLPSKSDILDFLHLKQASEIKFVPFIKKYKWDKKSVICITRENKKVYFIFLMYKNDRWSFHNTVTSTYNNIYLYEKVHVINNPMIGLDIEHYQFNKNHFGIFASAPKMNEPKVLSIKDGNLIKESLFNFLDGSQSYYRSIMFALFKEAEKLNGTQSLTPQFGTDGSIIVIDRNQQLEPKLSYYEANNTTPLFTIEATR